MNNLMQPSLGNRCKTGCIGRCIKLMVAVLQLTTAINLKVVEQDRDIPGHTQHRYQLIEPLVPMTFLNNGAKERIMGTFPIPVVSTFPAKGFNCFIDNFFCNTGLQLVWIQPEGQISDMLNSLLPFLVTGF